MDNFAPKKVFYDTAMNDTLYHSNDFDNISYKDLSSNSKTIQRYPLNTK